MCRSELSTCSTADCTWLKCVSREAGHKPHERRCRWHSATQGRSFGRLVSPAGRVAIMLFHSVTDSSVSPYTRMRSAPRFMTNYTIRKGVYKLSLTKRLSIEFVYLILVTFAKLRFRKFANNSSLIDLDGVLDFIHDKRVKLLAILFSLASVRSDCIHHLYRS